jgi:hypothetical protein
MRIWQLLSLVEALGNVAALRQNRVVSYVLNFIKNFALESISTIVRIGVRFQGRCLPVLSPEGRQTTRQFLEANCDVESSRSFQTTTLPMR